MHAPSPPQPSAGPLRRLLPLVRRLLPILPDVVVVSGLTALGLRLWPRPEAGGWMLAADRLLDGPDAAAWAANALALARGDLAALDLHRAPTYVMAVAALIQAGFGVAEAGHLVNHVCQLLLPLVLYGVARQRGGIGAGLLAGGLAAMSWPLVQASRFYGADPLIVCLLGAAHLAAVASGRAWGLGVLAGAVGALLAAAHYTTPPQLIPVLLMVLACGRGWRRFAAWLLATGTAAIVITQILTIYPVPDLNRLLLMIQEGVAKDSSQSGVADPNWKLTLGVAGPQLQHAFAQAMTALISRAQPPIVPFQLVVGCLWLGVFGFALRSPVRSGWRGWLERLDLLPGLVLLTTLAPLPVYAATKAPERYGWMLLPTGFLLIARGLGSVTATVDLGMVWLRDRVVAASWYPASVRRWSPPWPSGLLGVLVAIVWLQHRYPEEEAALKLRPVTPEAAATRKVGDALGAHFQAGDGAATPLREAAVYAGLVYCPLTVCPNYAAEDDYRRCLVIIRKECPGEGDIAWVSMGPSMFDQRSVARRAMDDWVRARFPVVEHVTSGSFSADIVSIPRTDAPEAP